MPQALLQAYLSEARWCLLAAWGSSCGEAAGRCGGEGDPPCESKGSRGAVGFLASFLLKGFSLRARRL